LALNDFWLFPKIKSALNGRRFWNTEDIQKRKSNDVIESHSTTGVPKIFPTVARCIIGQGEYFEGDPSQ